MYVDIARRLRRARFVFFEDMSARPSRIVQERLELAFREAGLEPRVLPSAATAPVARSSFFDILGRTDVYLDTIGFPVSNGVMQAIECGLPVVAHEGRFMRGRFGSGILKRMGMSELVARTDDEYVDKVVRLCEDAKYRDEIRQRIAGSKKVLFNDLAPVRALEDVLTQFSKLGVKEAPPFAWRDDAVLPQVRPARARAAAILAATQKNRLNVTWPPS